MLIWSYDSFVDLAQLIMFAGYGSFSVNTIFAKIEKIVNNVVQGQYLQKSMIMTQYQLHES